MDLIRCQSEREAAESAWTEGNYRPTPVLVLFRQEAESGQLQVAALQEPKATSGAWTCPQGPWIRKQVWNTVLHAVLGEVGLKRSDLVDYQMLGYYDNRMSSRIPEGWRYGKRLIMIVGALAPHASLRRMGEGACEFMDIERFRRAIIPASKNKREATLAALDLGHLLVMDMFAKPPVA